MHAVRRSLVESQAKALGIPLWDVNLPWPCSNADYECIMEGTCKAAVQAGIGYVAFGDLFLTDVRAYREKQMENSGLKPICALWGMPTSEVAHSMIKSGVRAKVTCVDPSFLAPEFLSEYRIREDFDLEGLIYEITYGDFSGVANVKLSEEVDRKL
jgi:diphthamide synthase (EF-2-diphthine--ammonia ligase)